MSKKILYLIMSYLMIYGCTKWVLSFFFLVKFIIIFNFEDTAN